MLVYLINNKKEEIVSLYWIFFIGWMGYGCLSEGVEVLIYSFVWYF